LIGTARPLACKEIRNLEDRTGFQQILSAANMDSNKNNTIFGIFHFSATQSEIRIANKEQAAFLRIQSAQYLLYLLKLGNDTAFYKNGRS
jgi:hypothetical protein